MTETPKQMRKELWDYLKAEGLQITSAQHERIKEIMDKYVSEASGIQAETFKKAMAELQIAEQGYNEWQRAKRLRQQEKNKRKRDRRAEITKQGSALAQASGVAGQDDR